VYVGHANIFPQCSEENEITKSNLPTEDGTSQVEGYACLFSKVFRGTISKVKPGYKNNFLPTF
jgi:hypothetical protein